ncbi:UvrD-helicase domain-containing protein [Mesorhizobium sp. M0091]|uniref:UvrD-helicase domain-containing protein n=1 Tax=Mesorhizobium sp. M0091 TaxID=2956875 RepID=UPI00333BB012
MRYLAVRRDAIEEIVASRILQSTDYDSGAAFSKVLKGDDDKDAALPPRLSIEGMSHGRIIAGQRPHEVNFIIFDLDEGHFFSAKSNDSDNVICFQRVLRFALKYWTKGILMPAEKIVGPRKAVVFPHPISQKKSVRVTLDLNPDFERLSKRGQGGRYLLAYKIGIDEGDGAQETASPTAFRKFIEDLARFEKSERQRPDSREPETRITTFSSTNLSGTTGRMDIHQSYEVWMRYLTSDQRRFVEAPLGMPSRIEGPAGTGKTLCLALKAIHGLAEASTSGQEMKVLFFTHSVASRKHIYTVFESMGGSPYLSGERPLQTLNVTTLQEFCASLLREEISSTEFVDPDAYDAKQLQILYIEEALDTAMEEFPSYIRLTSVPFQNFIAGEEKLSLIQLIQYEIAVVIKGRSGENFDVYKSLEYLATGIPATLEGDKAFIWRIYDIYKTNLETGGQFDTDDVIISAISHLTTPIWRRRRRTEGCDMIFIDETHLFNMNELSVFHHLSRSANESPIAFAVDRAQAIGDQGWTNDRDVSPVLSNDENSKPHKTRVDSVFRCSAEIVNLAFSVTSSGASLFTNFQDPMEIAHSSLTFEEERMSRPPLYLDCDGDADIVEKAFERAEAVQKEMDVSRSEVAIIAFSDDLFRALMRSIDEEHRPYETLKDRGDVEVVRRARSAGRFVISMPEYVGGLEFAAVILIGVDDGRVPPTGLSRLAESKSYLTYVAHNKLYVSITRARYRVEILGARERGPSSILVSAISTGVLGRSR